MKRLISKILLIIISVAFISLPNQIKGQEMAGLYDEYTANSLLQAGVWIEGYSLVNDPQQKGMFVTYRRVLRIEKVATMNEGKKPWFYLVYFGPSIPSTGWAWWAAGDPAPWASSIQTSQTNTIDGLYQIEHVHTGCKSTCSIQNKIIPFEIQFTTKANGVIEGRGTDTRGVLIYGKLSGSTLNYDFYDSNNQYLGYGTYFFTPDFKSFAKNSTFFDITNGHQGTIWGTKN